MWGASTAFQEEAPEVDAGSSVVELPPVEMAGILPATEAADLAGSSRLWRASISQLGAETQMRGLQGTAATQEVGGTGMYGNLSEMLEQEGIAGEACMTLDFKRIPLDDLAELPAYIVRRSCEGLVQEKLMMARRRLAEEQGKVIILEKNWEKFTKVLCRWERTQEFYVLQAQYQKKVTERIRLSHGEGNRLAEQQQREARFEEYKKSAMEQCFTAFVNKEMARGDLRSQDNEITVMQKMLRVMEEDAERQITILEQELEAGETVDTAMKAAGVSCKCEDPTCLISPFPAQPRLRQRVVWENSD